jgi:Ser/Thr protein kinase RdoA (MazF antagonist)
MSNSTPEIDSSRQLLEMAVAAAKLYPLPEVISVNLSNLSENAVFKLEAEDGRNWALRIHRDGYHSKTAIESELAWLMDLRKAGVVITPRPVKNNFGELVRTIAHHSMPWQRHVVLFEWEQGFEPQWGDGLEATFEQLGEIAARMHLHVKQWQRPDWFTRHIWDFETSLGDEKPHWGRWRDGMGVDEEKAKLFARAVEVIGKRLDAYGKGPERFGLIHGDLRLANLLVDGGTVKVIDFDDCGFGWYMYDAAATVSFYEHEPQVPALIECWKEGYRRVAGLPKADEAEIPTFVMLRRLLLVAWIGSHRETDLAKSMGIPYTDGTAGLCEEYLRKFG